VLHTGLTTCFFNSVPAQGGQQQWFNTHSHRDDNNISRWAWHRRWQQTTLKHNTTKAITQVLGSLEDTERLTDELRGHNNPHLRHHTAHTHLCVLLSPTHIEENLKISSLTHQVNFLNNDDIWESMEGLEHDLLEIPELENNAPWRKWSTGFSNMKDVLNFSKQHKPSKGLSMATCEKPNFEDSLFILTTPSQIQESQDMSEPEFEYFGQINRDSEMMSEEPWVHNGTNLSTNMSCILQRVKRIREMLEISFLTKQDLDDQLSFEGTSTLLQTGHFEQDEKTPSFLLTDDLGPSDYNSVDPCLFQGWPTLPLTEEDTNWGDCPDDASDISEDWDDYYPTQGDDYSVKKGVGFVK
jgi:hypothetical protein